MVRSLVVVAAALAGVSVAHPSDWPQWRGPRRDATSAVGRAVQDWPPELVPRWRIAVGEGQSSPVTAGGLAFLFTREGDAEVARGLDLATGALRWRREYSAPYRVYPGAVSYGSGPKSTPVVHEGRLFTLGISGILTAFDTGQGRIVWQKDFAGRFPAEAPPFGATMSPLVVGGLLIVHAGGHDGGALIAFDPATGAEKWQLPGEGPSYSSPILTTFSGEPQLVIQVHRKLLGVEPSSGRVLWSLPFVTPCDQNIVTPLRAGDLIVVSSHATGTRGIRVTREAEGWKPQTVWHTPDVSMYMSSPILVGGTILGLSQRRKGQYFALDPATGAVLWTGEPGQGENAAFVRAGNSVLALQGDGTLLILPETGPAFSPARRYHVASSATFAHPVPTDAGLLIKDETGLALLGWDGGPRVDGRRP